MAPTNLTAAATEEMHARIRSTMDSYVADVLGLPGQTSFIFTLKEKPGALAETLKIFQEREVNLEHVESRPSRTHSGCYQILVKCSEAASRDRVQELIELFRDKSEAPVAVYDWNAAKKQNDSSVPWFPNKIADIDQFANRILSYGAELDADHPGFRDQTYRARRKEFADIAFNYKHGEKIPRVIYTPEEIATWRSVYNELTRLYPTHACKEFNHIFPLLEQHCGYSADNIPQLQDISDFLKECTGFTLRPVAGLLSSRDFLAGLAFRVFHSTQYIRHASVPNYTPEPDVCHELLGHAPLFADPHFAALSQEIGLASLGADDETITKLATLYWFTIEFGVCLENGAHKAYGAGLLSSFGELEYSLGSKPELAPFEPAVTAVQNYPITQYQPKYFVADSFASACEKLKTWATTIARPFHVHYNAYTQKVDILDRSVSLHDLVAQIRGDVQTLESALVKLNVSLKSVQLNEKENLQTCA